MLRWCILIFVLHSSTCLTEALLFPDKATSLGLIASVSVPITELLPERRLIIDWCLQMAFDLPGSVASFYNIPIWPIKKKTKRHTETVWTNSSDSQWALHQKYSETWSSKQRHPSDFTAGELYKSIELQLSSFGYHHTCLPRSICELAQHPFADDQQNILTDMITFLLTPSWHQGFDETDELHLKLRYEDAETRGFDGENCAKLYADCEHNLLNYLTNVLW